MQLLDGRRSFMYSLCGGVRPAAISRAAANISGHEGRDPPRVRARPRPLLVRQRVLYPLDEAGAARGDLLRVPPVLYRQAEAGRHRWPGRALQAPRRPQPAIDRARGPNAVVSGVEGDPKALPMNVAVTKRTEPTQAADGGPSM